jgi:hypothetical protein
MSNDSHPGYAHFAVADARVIVRADVKNQLFTIMSGGDLYAWAAAQSERRTLQGRLPAYAVPLLGAGFNVVVRHNHHGGWLARLRGDRFFQARAPYELSTSWFLTQSGIPTPEVIACVIYRVNMFERRSDVATRELPPGRDFGALLDMGVPAPAALAAIAHLMHKLGQLGAWHPDLNVKNIYVSDGEQPVAYVLDVDRVRFAAPDLAGRANVARLARSVRKRTQARGEISDGNLTALIAAIAEAR